MCPAPPLSPCPPFLAPLPPTTRLHLSNPPPSFAAAMTGCPPNNLPPHTHAHQNIPNPTPQTHPPNTPPPHTHRTPSMPTCMRNWRPWVRPRQPWTQLWPTSPQLTSNSRLSTRTKVRHWSRCELSWRWPTSECPRGDSLEEPVVVVMSLGLWPVVWCFVDSFLGTAARAQTAAAAAAVVAAGAAFCPATAAAA